MPNGDENMTDIMSTETIVSKIHVIRGVKVMLDRDLAELYGVETKQVKRAVRRNIKRFPSDFMFDLSYKELTNLRSQFGASSWGGVRYPPMAFTEQGVAMLSGVLNSDRAIKANIKIMRAFVKMRHLILDNVELKRELSELKSLTEERFQVVFEVLDKLMDEPDSQKREIGYIKNDED